ncbi:beta-TrCP-like [Branchiostoma lanceolatum]|uniref:beta-TrCP-like n=1 Tax=Branchiostoma lanceolatum TaxID=7740 RepID=UPI0034554A7B
MSGSVKLESGPGENATWRMSTVTAGKGSRGKNAKAPSKEKSSQSHEKETRVPWESFGGRIKTPKTVEFDRQLDHVAKWVEEWSHKKRIVVLEALLKRCNYQQFQFLWTVSQPTLHRDFMFAAKRDYPSTKFVPISTHLTREIRHRLELYRSDKTHRLKSALLQTPSDVKHANQPETAFPRIGDSRAHSKRSQIPLSRSTGSVKLPSIRQQSAAPGEGLAGKELSQSAPVSQWLQGMPSRRHVQEEVSPRGDQGAFGKIVPSAGTMRKAVSESFLSKDERAQTRSGILPREAWQLILWFEQSWDDVKRNEFLHKLLLKLDPRQHFFISSYLSVKQYRDFITLLPEHLALKILSYLKPTELLSASRVSQVWNRIISDQGLWRVKCYETVMKLPITAHVQDWKKLYKDNWFLQRNWDIGRCRITEIRGHSDKVLSVAFEGRRMASGSADKLVRVWDIKTGNLLHTLKGHTKGIWCLQFFTKHLILSGSYDSTIKIWNLRTNTCARTLFGHEGPVWALVRKDVMMVTGSQDKTAKIWEIRRCRLAHTLKGHSAAVFAVDMDDDCTIVITGSADRSIRIWSCESGRSLKTIWASHTTSIMTVSYHRGFFACSSGGIIFLWNLKTATCIKKFHEHEKRVEKLQLQITNPEKVEGLMVSAGKDGMIKYWDISKDKSIQTMKGHKGQINCIQFDETKMATASADGKIRVWDFHISSKTDTNVVRVKDYVDPT